MNNKQGKWSVKDKKRNKRCVSCKEVKPDVVSCVDPYVQDIDNKTELVNLCDNCYQNKVDDI